MYGPSGIGGLILSPELDVATTRFGGTGMSSYSLVHSQTYPLRLEAGTLNLLGVIGLLLGVNYVSARGMDAIQRQEMRLLERLRDGLAANRGITLYCAADLRQHLPVLAANVAGVTSEDVGAILDGDYRIAVRSGLHCAPMVHRDLGTIDRGAVRFSLGLFNTEDEVDLAIEAMNAIARVRPD